MSALRAVPSPALTLAEAKELAGIMNRARSVDLRDGLHLVCKTPEDCTRACALLAKQGREPQRLSVYKVMCAPRSTR